MLTVSEQLRRLAEQIRDGLTELVSKHSGLHRWNDPGSALVSLSGDYAWNPLTVDGRRAQAEVLDEYRRFGAIVEALLRGQPSDTSGRRACRMTSFDDGLHGARGVGHGHLPGGHSSHTARLERSLHVSIGRPNHVSPTLFQSRLDNGRLAL
jgi:hypothetical protein